MQSIQIQSGPDINPLLRAAGVKRIHAGWYTVQFNGVLPDNSTEPLERINALRDRLHKFETLAADLAIELQEGRKVMFAAAQAGEIDQVKTYLDKKGLIK